MKIGMVTGEYPPQQGGVGDYTRELARALVTLGHDAQVITSVISSQPSVLSGERADEIVVRRAVHSWGTRCWGEIGSIAKQNQLEALNIQYEPAAYAMRVGVNFLPSAWVRRQIKVPIITTFHDLLVPYLFPKAGSLRWKVVEYLARRSDAVVVTNEEDRARLSTLHPPISNLQIIPIGSNIDPLLAGELDRVAERARWGIQTNEQVLGYFGFLNLSKGGSDLIQVLKHLRDDGLPVKLLLIGGRAGSSDPTNVEYATQVDRLMESLGVKEHVTTTGYLNSRDVSRALFSCDVVVLPYVDGASLRRGSLLAAIAHGRAIVTTEPRYPIEGLKHEQSALFVPPGNPVALTDCIRRVLMDEAMRRRLEHGAGEAAKLYTWDRIAVQLLEVYQAVVGGSQHATPSS